MKDAIAYLTYLAYLAGWLGLTVGGCAYVVFFNGASGWWFVLAILCATSSYPPDRWMQLSRRGVE